MDWEEELLEPKEGLQVAPLIDVVFLLLIYFMVTATLRKTEADIGFSLPGTVFQSQQLQMPDEQIIEVVADGRVVLNNTVFGEEGAKVMPELEQQLGRYRLACAAAGLKALITIQAEDKAKHGRVVDVMNACAGAGIKHVTFGLGQ